MRNRHIARVCRSCQAPMASAADSCWRCGVEWAPEAAPPTTLRLVTSDAAAAPASQRVAATAAAMRSRRAGAVT